MSSGVLGQLRTAEESMQAGTVLIEIVFEQFIGRGRGEHTTKGAIDLDSRVRLLLRPEVEEETDDQEGDHHSHRLPGR